MSEAKRKAVDCRLYPSEKGCTLRIEGTEEEVLEAQLNTRLRHMAIRIARNCASSYELCYRTLPRNRCLSAQRK
jgi:hypothetical protein